MNEHRYCCPNCFLGEYLKATIISRSTQQGTCHFCDSNNQSLISPTELAIDFIPVVDLYENISAGKSLAQCMSEDWAIWNPSFDIKKREYLLDCILGKEISTQFFALKNKDNLDAYARTGWNAFSRGLKHENRFFIHKSDFFSHISQFGNFLEQFRLKDIPQRFYRARINFDDNFFTITDMYNPPPEKAQNGRANPRGISYLYTATTPEGALHEVRPHIGAVVSVVDLELKDKSLTNIIDLRFLPGMISPFDMSDHLEEFSKEIPFWRILDAEMSRAIAPHNTDIDYLPIQYLCEYVKLQGFSGIAYKSVVSPNDDNFNVVFFSNQNMSFNEIKRYQIDGNTLSAIQLF